MRKRSALIIGLLLFGNLALSQAQADILGNAYDSLKEKLDPIPEKLKQICAGLGSQVKHYAYFTHYSLDGFEYYAVLDTSTPPSDDAYGYGSIILVHGTQCIKGDLDWALRGIPSAKGYSGSSMKIEMPGLNAPGFGSPLNTDRAHYRIRSAHEEEILRGLIKDAIQTAIKANGGGPTKAKLCKPANLKPDIDYPLVPMELARYCGVQYIPRQWDSEFTW